MSPLQLHPPPKALLAAISAVAKEELGAFDLQGAALAEAVRRVSAAYVRSHGSPAELPQDREALCARLKFFLPRDWPKIELPLAELLSVGALPSPAVLRVLDLGAGLGATSLGAASFALGCKGIERVRIELVDRDPSALRIAEALAGRFARSQSLAIELASRAARLRLGTLPELSPPYHLIVLGFVLNELASESGEDVEAQANWLVQLSRLLTEDGALIVLEPALRETSRNLQHVRNLIAAAAGPPYVFAPCLHREACPLLARERDWCHEQLPLELPPELIPIARAAGLRTRELTYSYLTLHRSQRSLAELLPDVRLLRVVSSPLPSKGKLELMVCSQGPTLKLRRLDRHISGTNRALENAGRGSILRLDPGADPDAAVQKVGPDATTSLLQTLARD
jgi:ribosomal protein RSM22 (predicted rRNA methylase)